MSKKSVFASMMAVLILAGGVVAGVFLVRQQQELREKAAVPEGEARVSLFPTSGDLKVGDSLPISVYFNTANIAISSINLRLVYPFSGTSAEIMASNIAINPVIENSGNWSCPKKSVTTEGQNIAIEIGCWNQSAMGYATNSDTLFATFDLKVDRVPQANPFSLSFDPVESMITRLSDGQDILDIPDVETGVATYTIILPTGPSPTPTKGPSPTPTKTPIATATPTKVPTATPTMKLSPTPTKVLTTTLTPTPTKKVTPIPTVSADLPDAGFSTPTYIGLGMGIILLVAAVLLAI